MSRTLIRVVNPKFGFGVEVPQKWDYFVDTDNNNKRIYFQVNPFSFRDAKLLGWRGFRIIIGLFYFWFALRINGKKSY